MNTHEKELGELLEQLDLDEDQVKDTLEDIQLGDELMDQFDRISVDPAILTRVDAKIRQTPLLQFQTAGHWWRQVVVMAASLLIVLGVTLFINPSSPYDSYLDDELDGYWQQALVMENETKREVDDMILSEVLQCWSDAEWDVDDILDPQDDGQQNPLDVSRNDWIGHLLCE